MCGIAGIFDTRGAQPGPIVLKRMASSLAHRGPDGERFYFDGGLGLAHRHLRIIDLSEAALQPMSNEDGSIWLIFNGEIYNYVELRPQLEESGHLFRSHSDTETIIHAYEEWGEDCLNHFNGMFAFALWDSRRQRLFLARDRAGVKPLYYTWDGMTLIFASEIKALLMHPDITPRPNLHAITEYMSAMYNTGPQTWFEGINRLLPGHYISVSVQGLIMRRWWDLPEQEDPFGEHTESYYAHEVRRLLEDSARIRLRSDVPLGSHLSGGIDSSAIVALLSRQLAPHGERVRTFSGAFAAGPAYDERRYIHQVVARYRTEQSEVVPSTSDLARLLERIIWHMDEPAAGPGILLQWAVCDLTRRSGVIVVNGGQGGDETWGGYFGYVPAYLRTLASQAMKHNRRGLYGALVRDASGLLARGATRRSALKALAQGRSGRLHASTQAGMWAGEAFAAGLARETYAPSHEQRAESPLAAAMYYDFKWYLPALLQVEDRTSMAFSLESRAPLLDYRLLELSAVVPALLKMKGLDMKHILKLAVKDLLPKSIYRRNDKMGMPTPIAPWFRGELSSWVKGEVSTPIARHIFAPSYIEAAIREHASGRRDRSLDLWKLLNVTTWWRLFIEGDAAALDLTSGIERATAARA